MVFLHVGGDTVVDMSQLLAVLDARVRLKSPLADEYLQVVEREGRLLHICQGPPKSYVIAGDRVICSPISPVTLRKRWATGFLQKG